MLLSENFTLAEMLKSQTAERMGIANYPHDTHIECLKKLCVNILEPIRAHYRKPIQPSSGFRSELLCEVINSKKTSQHALGQAVDFEVIGVTNEDLCRWIIDNLEFDQLILECYTGGNSGWVHCSYSDQHRREVLTYDRINGYRKGLVVPDW
tara:strand:+ start:144 stop:599 length:456 start_codon:yes stop_codon:yes gene_type:complete